MSRRRPWIPDKRTGLVLGLAALAVGLVVLYDVYNRRGGKAPFPLSVILPY